MGCVNVQVPMPDSQSAPGVVNTAGEDTVLPVAWTIDQKTNLAQVTLHVKDIPALGYKALWIVPTKRPFVVSVPRSDFGDTVALGAHDVRVAVDKKRSEERRGDEQRRS